MALIHCPLCGGIVSDSAEKCVHCGLPLAVCADCGAVYDADDKKCPKCGCAVKKTLEKPAENQAEAELKIEKAEPLTNSADEAAWKNRLAAQRTKHNISRYVSYVFLAVMLICLISVVVMLVSWSKKDDFERLSTFNKTLNTARSLIMTIFIFASFNMVIKYAGGTALTYVSYRVIKREKLDVKSYVKTHIETVSKEDEAALDYFSVAAYWEDNPEMKTFEIIKSAVCTVSEVLTAIFLAFVAIFALVRPSMVAGKFEADFEQIDFITWFLIAIFGLISMILETVFDMLHKRRFKKWLYEFLEIKEQK